LAIVRGSSFVVLQPAGYRDVVLAGHLIDHWQAPPDALPLNPAPFAAFNPAEIHLATPRAQAS
jgi:hypothetical protein